VLLPFRFVTVKRSVQLLLSILGTSICFWWTFKDTRWAEMWGSIQSANWWWLGPYFGVLLMIHLSRTLRWGNLLSGIEPVKFGALNEASAIGFMLLIILPFRLGEFARPMLIAQRSGIRKTQAMTSVVLERIVDGIFIAVLLQVLLFFVPPGTPELSRVRIGGNLMFAVFFGGLLFLLLARWQEAWVLSIIRKWLGLISAGLAARVCELVEGFVGALRQLPDSRNRALFAFWTLVYWLCNGLGNYVLSLAFRCDGRAGANLCVPLTLSLFSAFVMLSVLIIGLMIPAAPGSAGTFQAFVLLGMSLFLTKDAVNGSGVAYANVLWVLQIAQQIAFGLFYLFKSHVSLRELTGKLSANA
jgi:glycosyltransferase 2 family protein